MDKLKMHSPDITQENIAKIEELFPGCVVTSEADDGGLSLSVDFEKLKQELTGSIVEGTQERYQLDWPGKREALVTANAPLAKTLRPVIEESREFETTKNLFVEGDNLEALKLLRESYLGKIKLIYIDPPYNTGNDFVYDDDFEVSAEQYFEKSLQVDFDKQKLVANATSNGRFHSDWLGMMYARLRLARSLLSENGFIFVSIDVIELANLIAIGREVFGENSLVGVISRSTGTRMGSGSRGIARELDYIVVFSRSDESHLLGLPMTDEEMAIYDQEDERGKYLTRSLRRTGGENRREDRPSMFFPVVAPDGTEVLPIAPEGYESRWVCGKETYAKQVSDGMIEWKKVKRGGVEKWQVYQKHYMSKEGRETSDLWTGIAGNKKATKEVSAYFGKVKVFDHPKPVDLLERIISLSTKPHDHDIVVDFFAGSGTTAEAVFKKNASDGGNRRFIMIQIAEEVSEKSEARKAGFDNIADVTKQRIRLAGDNIANGQNHSSWNKDIGFRVLRVDSSNMQDVYYTPDQTNQSNLLDAVDNFKPERVSQDILFQVLVDWGVDLTLPVTFEAIQGKQVFFVDENALVACFDTGVTEELVIELAKREPLRVVFRDNGFVSDSVKINVEQIFKQLSPMTDVKAI